jgi:hypothetical protein
MAITTGHGRSVLFRRWVVLISLAVRVLIKPNRADNSNRFGWTGYTRSIHWMAPTASGVLTGFGILCIFLQCFNYIIDSYLML